MPHFSSLRLVMFKYCFLSNHFLYKVIKFIKQNNDSIMSATEEKFTTVNHQYIQLEKVDSKIV